jgi:hypothetical protein
MRVCETTGQPTQPLIAFLSRTFLYFAAMCYPMVISQCGSSPHSRPKAMHTQPPPPILQHDPTVTPCTPSPPFHLPTLNRRFTTQRSSILLSLFIFLFY